MYSHYVRYTIIFIHFIQVLVLLGPDPLDDAAAAASSTSTSTSTSTSLRDELMAELHDGGSHATRYAADVAMYSLDEGSLPAMVRARARLSEICGGRALLRALLCVDERRRPSAREVLLSPAFNTLAVHDA